MQRFLRKAMSILLAIAIMLAVIPGFPQPAKADPTDSWADFAVTEFAGGTGKQIDPYLIATEAQLAYLAQQVNTNTALYSGKYFKLTADLDLSAHEWVGIGSTSYRFQGNFDGDNHNCYASGSVSGTSKVGGLIGKSLGGAVSNCYTTGSVSGSSNVGGLIGFSDSALSYSWSNTTINVTTERSGGFSGHLGNDDSNIINCYFKDNTYGGDDGIGTIDTRAGTPSCTNKPDASFYSDAATYTTAENWDTAAWDLDSTWILNSGDNYPTLRNMPVEPAEEPELTGNWEGLVVKKLVLY